MAKGRRVASTQYSRYNNTSVVNDFFNGVQKIEKKKKQGFLERVFGNRSLTSYNGTRVKKTKRAEKTRIYRNPMFQFATVAVSAVLALVMVGNCVMYFFTNLGKNSNTKNDEAKTHTESLEPKKDTKVSATSLSFNDGAHIWSPNFGGTTLVGDVNSFLSNDASPTNLDESILSSGVIEVPVVEDIPRSSEKLEDDNLDDVVHESLEPGIESEVLPEEVEVDITALSTEEKVDYLMNKYNLSLEELNDMLGEVEQQSDENDNPVEVKEIGVLSASSASNITPIDFTGYYQYEGTDEALMKIYGFSEQQWIDYCKIMITESEPRDIYIETFATATTSLNRLAYIGGYGTNLYDIATSPNQYVVYQEGLYKQVSDIYDEAYSEYMRAIRDALYNFALDQSKRVHNYLEFRAHGTGKYNVLYTTYGNEYGVTMKNSKVGYVNLDISPLQELSLLLVP